MGDIKTRRNEIKPELKLQGMNDQAQRYLQSVSGAKFLGIFPHWKVKDAQQAYLNAQQRLVDVRREDIMHYYVLATAQIMKQICEQARDAVQHWILHLSNGDDANAIPGLWYGIGESLREVNNAHSYDKYTPKVQQLVADKK